MLFLDMAKIFKTFLYLVIILQSMQSFALAYITINSDIASFCKSNGLDFITITGKNELLMYHQYSVHNVHQKLSANTLRSRILNLDQLAKNVNYDIETQILIMNVSLIEDNSTFLTYVEKINSHKIQKSILVFYGVMSKKDECLVNEKLQKLAEYNFSNFFFMIYQTGNNETIFKRIISMPKFGKLLVQNVDFYSQKSLLVKQVTDLEDVHIVSNSLSFDPYVMLRNCNHNGENCRMAGILADLMEIMGKFLNFSWTSHKQPDGNWGSVEQIENSSKVFHFALFSKRYCEAHILIKWFKNFIRNTVNSPTLSFDKVVIDSPQITYVLVTKRATKIFVDFGCRGDLNKLIEFA